MAVVTIKSDALKEDERWESLILLPQVCQVTNTKFILKISVGKHYDRSFP